MTYEDALRATKPGTWEGLSFASRLEVLQTVENHAAAETGRTPRTVKGAWLHDGPDSVELGAYDPSDNNIYVNNFQLRPDAKYGKNADDLVETILHEGRHAYQHQVARGEVCHGDAQEAAAWAENMKPGNYVQFSQNPKAYWEQPIEADARAHASKRLEQFRQERAALGQGETARDVFERQAARQGAGEGLARHAESNGASKLTAHHGRSQR